MINFIYKEFTRSIGAFPLRSVSFILSFICTYFILLMVILFIRNVFDSFKVLATDYKISLILTPDFQELETRSLGAKLKEIHPDLSLRHINPSMVFRSLEKSKIDLELTDEEVTDLVPALAEITLGDLGPVQKVKLTKKIKDQVIHMNNVDEIVTPYPKIQKMVEVYYKNRLGLWLFITALYASIFVLLFLLLSLSLREHQHKTDLLKILGFKKNYIRGPLILEAIFLSSIGFIFALSILFALSYQLQQEYGDVLGLNFFSHTEVITHVLVNISLVFFLTTLMTRKIIREDYVEDY